MNVPQGVNAFFIGKCHEIRHSRCRSIRQGDRAALEGAQGPNRARLPHAVEFPVYWHSENPDPIRSAVDSPKTFREPRACALPQPFLAEIPNARPRASLSAQSQIASRSGPQS